jgi:hypothetical protein
MIVSTIQEPKATFGMPAKSSPASKSAAPEIHATPAKAEAHVFPVVEGRSSIAGYDLKDWLIAAHAIAADPTPPR